MCIFIASQLYSHRQQRHRVPITAGHEYGAWGVVATCAEHAVQLAAASSAVAGKSHKTLPVAVNVQKISSTEDPLHKVHRFVP